MIRIVAAAIGLAGCVLAAGPGHAGKLPDGAHRILTVTGIGGSTPITVPVRYDDWGDEEVYVPEHGWERCIYGSCTYTVRAYYFDRWEPGPGVGAGRGMLGGLLGLD
jgi:hypothetical protein